MIRHSEVRLIGEDGSQLGIVSSQKALEIAESYNLDLVEISPQAKPPVCKIMDYGKYRFELLKKHIGDKPLMCAEFWVGWFDHWGNGGHMRGNLSARSFVPQRASKDPATILPQDFR